MHLYERHYVSRIRGVSSGKKHGYASHSLIHEERNEHHLGGTVPSPYHARKETQDRVSLSGMVRRGRRTSYSIGRKGKRDDLGL